MGAKKKAKLKYGMNRINREKNHTIFSKSIEPVLSIKPGEQVVLETEDALFHTVRSDRDIYKSNNDMWTKLKGVNPVTGPIFVEGAEPGDNILVKIEKIKCYDPWTITTPGTGGLDFLNINKNLPATVSICKIINNMIIHPSKKGDVEILLEPLIGTMGVAPLFDTYQSAYHSQEHLGNVDIKDITIGNAVILPVNVKGALLSLGDVHAAQGDGEICGGAVECRAEVTITVDLIKRKNSLYMECPQIEYPNALGSIGCPLNGDIGVAIRAAYIDLIKIFIKHLGYNKMEALKIISQIGQVVIGQALGTMGSCVVKINKKFLK